MPRFAALDLGSNAMRLRIVEAHASGGLGREQLSLLPDSGTSWREVVNLRAPVRLGSEVFVTGKLAMASIGQACAALREFRQSMDDAKVDAYRATATSAVREASNGTTLVERARREAGIELEVIEGIEEARLIQLAVVRRLNLAEKRALLVDVGGGSTELTYFDKGTSVWATSLPIGTVRLLETYLRGVKTVERGRQHLLFEGVDRALAEAVPTLKKLPFEIVVGTGGSVDTLFDLCSLKGGYAGYPRAVDVAAMKPLLGKLFSLTAEQRRETYGLRPDRADTIVPASSIFLRVAELFKAPAIIAPGVGLKEGILEELIDKHFDRWDRQSEARAVVDGCLRLGKRYGFDQAHGELVASFATSLFDDMVDFHGFGDRERLLLRVAALLHDIGDYVRYDGHHKHSYYLIQNSDIMGLTPDERAIVANVARYHRKSPPDPSHPNFRDLDKESRTKVRSLAAILRIADALDREHLGKVRSVRAELDERGRKLNLVVSGHEERELEEWTVRAKSDLLRDVFDLDVTIAGSTGSMRPPPREQSPAATSPPSARPPSVRPPSIRPPNGSR
ncbi:MAG TPA: Ppx/GppA phosphatase family protein [Labilithrix sp.]|nr:Ppx/GppA phosphatase family protein [Labilithrix sp.]